MQFQIDAISCGGWARRVAKATHAIDPQAGIGADPTMKRLRPGRIM